MSTMIPISATTRPRVAVTRDEGPRGPLSTALRGFGLDPIPCRVIFTAPPDDLEALATAALTLDQFDWLVVASARAVDALCEARGGVPLPQALRTAAVGGRTALALRAAGAREVLTATTPGAMGLLEVLRSGDRWPLRRVLLPCAAEGRPELVDGLRSLGPRVEEVVAYRTLTCPNAEIVRDWRLANAEAVVVASPSAARALVGALGAAALQSLAGVIAIGGTTAAALAELGVPSQVSEAADFTAAAKRTRGVLRAAAKEA
jgi:uroporphyrinogen-III synthase